MRSLSQRLGNWWWDLSARRRFWLIATTLLILVIAVLGGILTTGVSAALKAQDQADELEAKLRKLTPIELTQPETYRTLGDDFRAMEDSMTTAQSRLGLLRLFTWVPSLGPRIDEALTLAELGSQSARLGRNVSDTFLRVWALPLEDMSATEAVPAISRALQDSIPLLLEAENNAAQVRALRNELKSSGKGEAYGPLIDQYLPLVEAILYLSRTTPDTVGQSYLVYNELTVLRQWADAPLSVMEVPGEVRRSLRTLDRQSLDLTHSLGIALQAAEGEAEKSISEETREGLRLLGQQVVVLRRVSRGVGALVKLWEAVASSGFLSQAFAQVASVELENAETELDLARRELESLQTLMASQRDLQRQIIESALGSGQGSLALAPGRFEAAIDEMFGFTRFLQDLLGFETPKGYLLLGQNPNEIRATGGFIGVAAYITIDRAELTNMVYYDSFTVDPESYIGNPPAPEGLYWHLWHQYLLFRDANWNPHFPASAAQIAEIFSAGQGERVDGVIAATKTVMLDLVELFGDVTVPEIAVPLDRETARAHIEEELSYPCPPRLVVAKYGSSNRCFDEDLFFALWDRLQQGGPPPLGRNLAQMFRRQFARKDLLIQVFDGEASTFLWEQGWNGVIPQVDHDYLMVVDSSLPGHSIEHVQRSWEYRVSLDTKKPSEPQLRIRYRNDDPPSSEVCRQAAVTLFGCYYNYLRILVSSRAYQIQAPPVPLHEGTEKLAWGYSEADSLSIARQPTTGLTEIGGFITIEPASILTVPVDYLLEPGVLRSTAPGVYEYRLLVQKQPGMDRDQITVAVRLPTEATLQQASPTPSDREGEWTVFDFTLEQDTTIVVSFKVS